MTMIEKILARASGTEAVKAGDIVECDVNQLVLLDVQFSPAGNWIEPREIADPDCVTLIMDHAVPASAIVDSVSGQKARQFVKKFGVTNMFDIGVHGISHQIIAEQGMARPGEVLACGDSHTCAGGAFNCAARGLGGPDLLQILCTGRTWYKVGSTIRYEFSGSKPEHISGKDVFLTIAARFGSATNRNIEFGGSGLQSIPINDRRTIATQCMEVGADFATFPADDVCMEYLKDRTDATLQPVEPDADADYDAVRQIDLGQIEPQVASPGTVINNSYPVSEFAGLSVDQCFIGSCANGQLEDLGIAAKILKGRHVSSSTRLIVTPASQDVYLEAVRRGYVEAITEAGGVVTNSTCGACNGYHMGVLGPGEVCLTASTRNFKGRMGSADAEIYMASPATVAATAVRGRVTDAGALE